MNSVTGTRALKIEIMRIKQMQQRAKSPIRICTVQCVSKKYLLCSLDAGVNGVPVSVQGMEHSQQAQNIKARVLD